eukprot:6200712-Pleurochrysis_carterae.AAC.3
MPRAFAPALSRLQRLRWFAATQWQPRHCLYSIPDAIFRLAKQLRLFSGRRHEESCAGGGAHFAQPPPWHTLPISPPAKHPAPHG